MRDTRGYYPAEEARLSPAELKRSRVLDFLKHREVFDDSSGRLVVDPERLPEIWKRHSNPVVQDTTDQELIEFLCETEGITKADFEQAKPEDRDRLPNRPLLAIPANAYSLAADYPEKAKQAIFNAWDFKSKSDWVRPIILPSGETSNAAEMMVATKLREWNGRRDSTGRLIIDHPETGQSVPFSGTNFDDISGRRISATTDKQIASFRAAPALFAEKYFSNLNRLGVLKPEDFRVLRGSKTEKILGAYEKKLNPKAPIVTIGSGTRSARYYIGRNRIVGTNFPINSETTVVRKLDRNTAAIVETVHGKRRILRVFELLSDDEIAQRQEQLKERYKAGKGKPFGSGIAAWSSVAADEMKDRMKTYDITKVLPKRPEESPEEYARRLADLNDPDFVLQTFRKFFAGAEIGMQSLKWSEQLVLANAILAERNADRLVAFVKNYGIAGLRTFLATEYDKEMPQKILELPEKNPEMARVVFEKYNEIIDAADQVESFLRVVFHGVANLETATVGQIKENLLRRGKDLLVQYHADAQSGKPLDPEQVAKNLANIKSGVLLFGATLREMRKHGAKIELEDLASAEVEVVEGLQPQDVAPMRKIYARNYQHVPEFQKELLARFDADTSPEAGYGHKDNGATYYILRVGGEIQAFNRFVTLGEDRETGQTHREFGWFNVNPDYQGFSIGEAMMERSLDEEARTCGILATCTADDSIAQRYISRGFVGYKYDPDYKTIKDLYIERVDSENRKYKSKFISQDEIISRLRGKPSASFEIEGHETLLFKAKDSSTLPFDLVNEGWMLVQYFNHNGESYMVLENLSPSSAIII